MKLSVFDGQNVKVVTHFGAKLNGTLEVIRQPGNGDVVRLTRIDSDFTKRHTYLDPSHILAVDVEAPADAGFPEETIDGWVVSL
jgi:hypothetical protein